jgi:nitrate reductase delta subunit
MMPSSLALGIRASKHDRQLGGAIDRVRRLARLHFELSENDAIFVAQIECKRPGCPPLQTVVVFWSADQTRRHFKVLKPAPEVESEDLPPTWLVEALGSFEQDDSPCC